MSKGRYRHEHELTAVLDVIFELTGRSLHLLFRLFGIHLINIVGIVWSRLAWYIFKEKRRMVREELRFLFGKRFNDPETENIMRRSFDNYYKKQAEYLFFGYLDKKTIEKMVQVEGLENLDRALAKGKGVILLLSHFGSFLLPLPFLAYRGYRVNQITGKEIHTSLLQDRFWRWRKREADRLPVNFIQVGNFLRPLYERLKSNELVAIAFDGREGTKWIPVKLLNRTALFSAGPVNLALKTGAAIIPTFIIRRENGRHKLILEPALEMEITGSKEDDLRLNTERYAWIFTRYLSGYPCHMAMVFQIVRSYNEKGLGSPLFQEVRN